MRFWRRWVDWPRVDGWPKNREWDEQTMTAKPWFQDGLRFECSQCGDCCTGAPGYVWVNREEIAALAAKVGLEVAEFEQRYVRSVGVRKSLVEIGEWGLRLFRWRKAQMHRLRGASAAVPKLALLGVERPHATSLGANVPGLSRQWQRQAGPSRPDIASGQHDPHLMAELFGTSSRCPLCLAWRSNSLLLERAARRCPQAIRTRG